MLQLAVSATSTLHVLLSLLTSSPGRLLCRGLKHTNADFLRRELAFLADAQSLHELSKSCMVLEEMLKGLGIFKSWRFVLDVAEASGRGEDERTRWLVGWAGAHLCMAAVVW